jgi:iron(III) transport system permease protein
MILAIFVLLIGLPLGLVLIQTIMPALFDPLHPTFALDSESIFRTFGETRLLGSILNSLLLAGAVSITATSLGAAYAFGLHRTDMPFKKFLITVPWLVFLTPAYLKGLAWTLLMSPGGYLSQLGLLPDWLSNQFFGPKGLIFVHTFNLFPLPYFVIAGALAGLGREFEDAARLSGAGLSRVWLRINLPLLLPAIALCIIAVYAEVLSDFGLASTIARVSGFALLTYGIYVAASAYPVDFALAGSQALILLLLVIALVLADRILRRQASARLISGRSKPARIYNIGPWRWLLAGIGLLIALFALYLPLFTILLRSLCRTLSGGLASSNLTTQFLLQAMTFNHPSNEALLRSLAYAGMTALIATVVSLVLALRLDMANKFVRPAVMGVALGTVAIPGIVLAFGYILVWNRLPFFTHWPFPHYGDVSLLVTGYVGTALPYCLVIIMTAVGQLAPSLTDAARLHGIGWLKRITHVVLPLVALSVITAFLFTFIRTVFELPMSELLVPVNGPAAPSVIIHLFGKDDEGMGSALSLLAMIIVGLVSAIIWITTQKIFARTNVKTDNQRVIA